MSHATNEKKHARSEESSAAYSLAHRVLTAINLIDSNEPASDAEKLALVREYLMQSIEKNAPILGGQIAEKFAVIQRRAS